MNKSWGYIYEGLLECRDQSSRLLLPWSALQWPMAGWYADAKHAGQASCSTGGRATNSTTVCSMHLESRVRPCSRLQQPIRPVQRSTRRGMKSNFIYLMSFTDRVLRCCCSNVKAQSPDSLESAVTDRPPLRLRRLGRLLPLWRLLQLTTCLLLRHR